MKTLKIIFLKSKSLKSRQLKININLSRRILSIHRISSPLHEFSLITDESLHRQKIGKISQITGKVERNHYANAIQILFQSLPTRHRRAEDENSQQNSKENIFPTHISLSAFATIRGAPRQLLKRTRNVEMGRKKIKNSANESIGKARKKRTNRKWSQKRGKREFSESREVIYDAYTHPPLSSVGGCDLQFYLGPDETPTPTKGNVSMKSRKKININYGQLLLLFGLSGAWRTFKQSARRVNYHSGCEWWSRGRDLWRKMERKSIWFFMFLVAAKNVEDDDSFDLSN